VTYRWRIFTVNLDPVVGSEQGRARPVLVISDEETNQLLPVVTALPITSRKAGRRVYPNEVLLTAGAGGLRQESLVLCYQIRVLDKRRLGVCLGQVEDPELQEAVFEALRFHLGMEEGSRGHADERAPAAE